ncbi:MAG TPA: FG-GAP-like repeat-containing protein [Isosphaeraceae bacterium]|nr:FG-GAP-like repeat-containing protein [Isosphaeraceae bacterium]
MAEKHRRRLEFEGLESRLVLTPALSTFPIRPQGQGGVRVALGADGNLWFTLASNNIGMMNPTTQVATQYPIPTLNPGASDITSGPDGNLWFVETAANQIGVINRTTGAVTEYPLLATANAQPQGITTGPDGNLWFTEFNGNQIGRLNPTTHAITEYLLPTANAQPFGITAGPDGNLWFTESGANQVGRINPTTHAIQEFTIPGSGNVQAEGITAGPDGNLWFTETGIDSIGMINPSTHTVNSFAIKTANAQPVGIAKGPDGNLWFAELKGGGASGGAVGSINPSSHTITEYTGVTFNSDPEGIVAAGDGNLWFTESGLSKLGQINPVSQAVKEFAYKTTTVGNPSDIALGSDGNLWFTQGSDPQIGFMNPTTHFTTQFKLPTLYNNAPAITSGPDGNLWFTEDTFSTDKIGVINPTTGVITEFSLPTTNGGPATIVTGPDGNLWFTELVGNKIARITTAGAIAEFSVPTASSQPFGIAAGPDGNLWFTESTTGKIGVINPTTHAFQEFTLPGGNFSSPHEIIAGPDGNLWFTERDAVNGYKIATINPTTHAVSEYPVAAGPPADVTVGPDHNIWFTVPGAGLVDMIDPTTHIITPLSVPKANPQALIAGSDGNLWFTGDGAFNGTTFDPNVLGVVQLAPATIATQLSISTQPPGSVLANHGFGLVVAIKTSGGALAVDYTGSISIALSNNPGGATLGGTLTAPVRNGVAIFSGLTLDKGGTGYKLQVSATGLTSATTNAFNVTLPASQLVVTTEPPAGVTAGAGFSLIVSAEDPLGNVDPNFAGNITLAINNNPAGGTLGGVTLVAATSGVATFSGLALDKAASGYTLQASSAGLTAATTSAITVSAASATKLVVTTQPPSTVTAGSGFDLTASAEDQFGNVDSNFSGNVIVAILNNPVGGTLGGVTTLPVTAGVAAFAGLTLDKAAGGYTLHATNTDLGGATTNPIAVNAAAATQLVVTTQPPPNLPAGTGFNLQVSAEDSLGNVDPSFNGTVALAIANNPGGGTLSGVVSVAAGAGVASFFGLKVDKGGNGYTIQATTAGLPAITTNAFNVTLPASHLVFSTAPPASVTAGAGFSLIVSAEDPLGNVDTGFVGTVTLALAANPGGSILGGTLNVPISSGVASFTALTLNKAAAGYTILATSAGLTSDTSSAIAVTGATATHLAVTTQPPTSVVAGTGFGVVFSAQDKFGNIDPNYSGSVVVTLSSNPGGSTLGGTTSVPASAGAAVFSGLTLNKAASGYVLQASSTGLASVTTSALTVNPATATRLVVTTQPHPSVPIGGRFSLVVSANDQFGNLATSFGGSITVALGANPSSGALGGTLTVSASAGVATFSTLTLKKSGRGYTLQATTLGLTGTTSVPFNVASVPGDFDGDGKTDTAIYDQTTSQFFILLSGGGAKTPQFGNPAHTNIPITGDFDGDGKADTAIYDQTTSQFFILLSGGGAKTPQFGNPAHTNIPIAGDFDGDGKADIAIYDQTTSHFFILLSGGGAMTPQFGNPAHTNIPIAGDFDGDGKTDVAIYDQTASQFFILLSGGGAKTPQFGNPSDVNIPLAGDFDGDGKADVAIYDRTTSQFFILLSGGGAKTPQFGNPAHKNIPVAGDFDGDGKADVAIYDQTTSQFFILLSGGGGLTPQFGNPADSNVPLPSTYLGSSGRTISLGLSSTPAAGGSGRISVASLGGGEIVPLVTDGAASDSAIWLFTSRKQAKRGLWEKGE